MIETPNYIHPEIKLVLFSVLAWQSYWFWSNNFVLCGVSQTQYGKEFWNILAQEVRVWGLADAVWERILDYSCSRSRSTFVLCGISQTQYGKEFWIILAQEVCRCRMGKNLGLFVLKKSEYFCALWGLAAAVTGYNFGIFVLKKSEYFCASWGLTDAVWQRILDYSCSRSQSTFVLCGVSQMQYAWERILDYSCSRSQNKAVIKKNYVCTHKL